MLWKNTLLYTKAHSQAKTSSLLLFPSFHLTQNDDDTAILTDVAVQDLEKVVHHTTKIDLKNGTGIDNLELSPELLDKTVC